MSILLRSSTRSLQLKTITSTSKIFLSHSNNKFSNVSVVLSRNLATATTTTPITPTSTIHPVPTDSLFAPLDSFARRHIGPQPTQINKMLDYLKFDSMDSFISECVPASIRIDKSVVSEEGENGIRALSEQELLRRAKELGALNKVNRSFIGMGYHQAVSIISLSNNSSYFTFFIFELTWLIFFPSRYLSTVLGCTARNFKEYG